MEGGHAACRSADPERGNVDKDLGWMLHDIDFARWI
jgi:hypothetical protein